MMASAFDAGRDQEMTQASLEAKPRVFLSYGVQNLLPDRPGRKPLSFCCETRAALTSLYERGIWAEDSGDAMELSECPRLPTNNHDYDRLSDPADLTLQQDQHPAVRYGCQILGDLGCYGVVRQCRMQRITHLRAEDEENVYHSYIKYLHQTSQPTH